MSKVPQFLHNNFIIDPTELKQWFSYCLVTGGDLLYIIQVNSNITSVTISFSLI
jgi:hypothetical protein